jgi:hypothetical protein
MYLFLNCVFKKKYFLYAPMSINFVDYAFTVTYLLLSDTKYILLLLIYLVLRNIALLVASLVVARDWLLAHMFSRA